MPLQKGRTRAPARAEPDERVRLVQGRYVGSPRQPGMGVPGQQRGFDRAAERRVERAGLAAVTSTERDRGPSAGYTRTSWSSPSRLRSGMHRLLPGLLDPSV